MSSCNTPSDIIDEINRELDSDEEIEYTWTFPETLKYQYSSSFYTVYKWMNENITYIEDNNNNWLLPHEVYENKGGDNKSLAGLLALIYKQTYSMEVEIVIFYKENDPSTRNVSVNVANHYRQGLGILFSPEQDDWVELDRFSLQDYFTYIQGINE